MLILLLSSHQIVKFFLSQNCHISRTALQGNATNKLSATTTTMEMREMQNNYSKSAAQFLAGFLPSLSN